MTILILFDFFKAFDSIPHALLLSKLKSLNISNWILRWLFTYLTDRVKAVVDLLSAASGVPQGSILGPLLFAIFFNDLPAAIRFAKVMIFADDTQLYLHFYPRNILQAIENMNRDAQAVADWQRLSVLIVEWRSISMYAAPSETPLLRLYPLRHAPKRTNMHSPVKRCLYSTRFKRELRAALMQRDVADWNTRVRNERFHASLLFPTAEPIVPLQARL